MKQDSNTTASRERAASTSHGPKLPGPGVVEEIGLSQATTEGNYDSFEMILLHNSMMPTVNCYGGATLGR